jgi:hypothetical protein
VKKLNFEGRVNVGPVRGEWIEMIDDKEETCMIQKDRKESA